jgi:hypothetical protein
MPRLSSLICSGLFALTVGLSGCASAGTNTAAGAPGTAAAAAPAAAALVLGTGADYGRALADVETMATMMAGPWTSAELAARDSTYLDIRSVNVRIWQGDPEYSGAWFYTESARPSAPTTPYRQNVFNLVAQEDGTVHAYQYRVRAPERFAGAALANRAPEGLTLDDLIALPGCTLVWHREPGGRFVGGMRPRACRNKFRGATWMDGSSWIEPGRFYTWDRGMNDAGEQVWGPTRAGYEFTRARN